MPEFSSRAARLCFENPAYPEKGPLAGGSEWPGGSAGKGKRGFRRGETRPNVRVKTGPSTDRGSGGRILPRPVRARSRGSGNPHKLSGEQLVSDATTGLLFPLEWSGHL